MLIMDNSGIIALAALAWLILGYRFYGRRIERKLVRPDDGKPTPAIVMHDGVDYSPAKPLVLFGHHFSSIAGAGPVLGPVAAVFAFGWGGGLLWILIGVVFIGAVHDYLSLILSVRHGGKSVPDLTGRYIGPRARLFFLFFVWVALVLVIAVFCNVAAATLASTPEVVLPTFGILPVAMLFGLMLNKMKAGLFPSTFLALMLLFLLVWLGFKYPLSLPVSDPLITSRIWFIILILYGLIASVFPVWLLLQPRDYLANWVLIIGLAAGFAGLFITHPQINAPAFKTFSDPVQGPVWPMMFILIACGAVSGFHSLVAGGTTAKQLARESDGRFIAYGGMLTEGAMGVLALLAVAAGLYWRGTGPAGTEGYVLHHFMEGGGGGPIKAFGAGFGVFTAPFFGVTLGTLLGITMLKTFVMTTLDTSVRLGRFITTELLGEVLSPFKNRWIASVACILPAYLLGATGTFMVIWPIFGSANQLVAAIALLVISAYLVEKGKPSVYTLVPAVFMLVTAIASIFWMLKIFLLGEEKKVVLGVVSIILLVLAGYISKESIRSIKGKSADGAV